MTAEKPREIVVGVALLALGGLCIGYAPIGLRFAVDADLGPQATAFWRYLFSIPMIYLCIRLIGQEAGKPNAAALLAGVFFAVDIGLWHLALTKTSVANATFIVNLGNVGVALLAWIVMKERPTWMWAVAATIAMTGAGFLSMGGATNAATSIEGDMLALGAAIMVSGYMLFAKIARLSMAALAVLFWATVAETVVALIMTLISGERFFPPSLEAIGWVISLSIVVQVAGQGLIIAGVGKVPAAIAGLMILMQPITAGLISWPLFGETLTLVQLFGAGLILIGMAIAQLRFAPKRSPVV